MNQCSQTRITRGFTLIVDDSGHRKSGNFTSGVGRQYIGEIGKTENGVVVVTTHLYDGKKSLPLDIALRKHIRTMFKGGIDTIMKAIKFVPPLPHPVFENKPPMLDVV